MHVCECTGPMPEHVLVREAARVLQGQPQEAINPLRLCPGKVWRSRASLLTSCWPEGGPLKLSPFGTRESSGRIPSTCRIQSKQAFHLGPQSPACPHIAWLNLLPAALPSTSLHSGIENTGHRYPLCASVSPPARSRK